LSDKASESRRFSIALRQAESRYGNGSRGLPADDRKRIGENINTVEFGWPIGMPVCRPLGGGIHEVRTNLAQN
jgi:hypothetical protein